jgi:pimeloyl-ACP methyl ester carboxylesterase
MRTNSRWAPGIDSKRYALIVAAILIGCSDQANGHPRTSDASADLTSDSGATAMHEPDAGTAQIDRGHLSDTGTDPLDYGDPALWLCKPGNDPNECLANIDATEFRKDGSQRVAQHVPATDPAYDCFYVYPTVDISGRGNTTDFSDVSYILDALLNQAARFNRICEVYAPLYRQQSFGAGGALSGDAELAHGDVERAFLYYMEHFNHGRKFVIVGHSQGTNILSLVMSKHIDADPKLRARMISAVLIGGAALYAPEGQHVGGTFQHIPFCTAPGQPGCVIAYDSFAKEVPPSADTEMGFGHAPAGSVNACTNPSLLAGNAGRYRGSYFPAIAKDPLFMPGLPANEPLAVSTQSILVRDLFSGECVHRDGLSYLEISVDQAADDARAVPAYRYSLQEQLGIGMHTGDFSVPEDDLIDAVEQQAKAMR